LFVIPESTRPPGWRQRAFRCVKAALSVWHNVGSQGPRSGDGQLRFVRADSSRLGGAIARSSCDTASAEIWIPQRHCVSCFEGERHSGMTLDVNGGRTCSRMCHD
jgi:hypothetical protein